MRTWLWTLILFGLAVLVAVMVHDYPGAVVVMVPPYRIEVSLARAIVMLLVLFLLLHLVLRFTGWTLGSGARFRSWREGRRVAREHDRLEQGWIDLVQGHYVRAADRFRAVAGHAASPERTVLARLSEARALAAQGDDVGALQALASAQPLADERPELGIAVACLAAEILLDRDQPREALARLQAVGDIRHAQGRRVLRQVYLATGHWNEALSLARELARRERSVSDTHALALAAAGCLSAAPDDAGRHRVWKSLKADERVLPEVALAAADAFAEDPQRVRKLLQAALDVKLDAHLLDAYAACDRAEASVRLTRGERWLQEHPLDADLLRVLGVLCARAQLWGPAQGYFERSLRQRDDPRTHALLGSLHDRLERPEDATGHWRMAAAAAVGITVFDAVQILPAADTRDDPLVADSDVFDADSGEPVPPLPPQPSALAAADDSADDELALGAADLPPTGPDDVKATSRSSS